MYTCPICKKEVYVEGTCLRCTEKLERERYKSLTQKEIKTEIEEIISDIKKEDYIEKAQKIISFCNVNTEKNSRSNFRCRIL